LCASTRDGWGPARPSAHCALVREQKRVELGNALVERSPRSIDHHVIAIPRIEVLPDPGGPPMTINMLRMATIGREITESRCVDCAGARRLRRPSRLRDLLAPIVVLPILPVVTFARWDVHTPQHDCQHRANERRRQMGFPGNPGLDRKNSPHQRAIENVLYSGRQKRLHEKVEGLALRLDAMDRTNK